MPKPSPDVLLPDYQRVQTQYPGLVEALKKAAVAAGPVLNDAEPAWEQIRQERGIPDTDFARLAELAGWGRLKYNPELILAWEEALLFDTSGESWIQRGKRHALAYTDWTHRERLLDIVIGLNDPESLTIIAEVARLATRDLEGGAMRSDAILALRKSIALLVRDANPQCAAESADTIGLAPNDVRAQVEKLIGNGIVKVGSCDNGKNAAAWRAMLDDLERKDSSWSDRANTLRSAIDIGIRQEEEWKRNDEERRRQIEEQERRVKEKMEQQERK